MIQLHMERKRRDGAYMFQACPKCRGDLIHSYKQIWSCIHCGHDWYKIKNKLFAVRHDPTIEEMK